MTTLTAFALVGIAIVLLEALCWGLSVLSARFFSTSTPNRRQFLSDQSRMLDRLINGPPRRETLHPVLGWAYRAGYSSEADRFSAQGLRASREYAPEPPPGVRRVAAFGDSYVYCNDVADGDSWPAQIEAGWRSEVLNYGVGGYGADQALLRFRAEAALLKPHIVVMGFTSMMSTRVVSRYRRFQDPGDGPWFKPRFLLDGDSLRLVPSPVASREDAERLLASPASVADFGTNDFWYNPAVLGHWPYAWSATYRFVTCTALGIRRRYITRDRIYKGGALNPESESFEIITRIFVEFAAAVRAGGAEPLALMLPARSDVDTYARLGRASYETLRARLQDLGLRVIDVASALTSSPSTPTELFGPRGHYSARGNAIVAGAVAEFLGLPPRSWEESVRSTRESRI